MSLLHVLKSRGVERVTVVDISIERLGIAASCGADEVTSDLTGRYDAVFDAVGTTGTRLNAVACCMSGGTVVLIGLHSDELQVSAGFLISREITIKGSFAYTPEEFRQAVDLAATVPMQWVVSVPFDDAAPAFTDMLAGRGVPSHIKTLFDFSPKSLEG